MNKYRALYHEKQTEVYAEDIHKAQSKAAKSLNVPISKSHKVYVWMMANIALTEGLGGGEA